MPPFGRSLAEKNDIFPSTWLYLCFVKFQGKVEVIRKFLATGLENNELCLICVDIQIMRITELLGGVKTIG